MAEAFGIAGSAFGTVSLGLQLFKEIAQYLDDIHGREEDLKEARNYATNVQLSLNALDIALSKAPTGDPATKDAIDSCKTSCVSAVNNLLAVVKELRGPTVTLPNSNAARAKELCAKLRYPFKKQNIEKLEEILSRTNSALQTILQVFQLYVQSPWLLNRMSCSNVCACEVTMAMQRPLLSTPCTKLWPTSVQYRKGTKQLWM